MLTNAKSALITVLFLSVGCSAVSEKELLLFPVKEQINKIESVTITPERTLIESLNLMGFEAYDDKLIATADFSTDHFLEVMDLSSGVVLHQLCRKGRGPGEFLDISPLFSIEGESIIVYDAETGKMAEVSVDGGSPGAVTHQVKIESSEGGVSPIIMSSYKVTEEEVIAYNSIQGSPEFIGIENPYYAFYDWNSGKETRSVVLFDAAPVKDVPGEMWMSAFELRDCINSRKTTVCFGMHSMPVLGFIDIRTGQVTGFRLKGEPAFSVKEPKLCFTGICAQDRYIYALYFGKANNDYNPETGKSVLYKIDWDGNVLKKYELDGLYRSCCSTSDKLYLSKIEADYSIKLYQLNINDL
jgi:hypothetical protein